MDSRNFLGCYEPGRINEVTQIVLKASIKFEKRRIVPHADCFTKTH